MKFKLVSKRVIEIINLELMLRSSTYRLKILEPTKVYCINIANLPPKIDGESLSKEFNWPIYHILMRSVADEQSPPTECWLKSVNSEQIADDFVKEWNGKLIFGY